MHILEISSDSRWISVSDLALRTRFPTTLSHSILRSHSQIAFSDHVLRSHSRIPFSNSILESDSQMFSKFPEISRVHPPPPPSVTLSCLTVLVVSLFPVPVLLSAVPRCKASLCVDSGSYFVSCFVSCFVLSIFRGCAGAFPVVSRLFPGSSSKVSASFGG